MKMSVEKLYYTIYIYNIYSIYVYTVYIASIYIDLQYSSYIYNNSSQNLCVLSYVIVLASYVVVRCCCRC